MLTIVCWKWKPPNGYRSVFGPSTVNTLRRMVARHYSGPHEFACITDDAQGIDSDIRIIPLWDDWARVPNPHGHGNPSCYRRLRAFSPEAATLIGPRFVSLDLDVVITGDLRPLWDRPEDFVIWGDTARGTPYNGSMFLLRAGTRTKVWRDFDPATSPKRTRMLGYVGSDQAWIAAALGASECRWSALDGVYSYRNEIHAKLNGHLPRGARIVVFHGRVDPWEPTTMARHGWVREHYR